MKPKWWPFWKSNEPVAIIASGPSTALADLSLLANRFRVIAIKSNAELCPWADICYSCDGDWWHYKNGFKEFRGMRMAHDGGACNKYGLARLDIKANIDRLLFSEHGVVGSGGCSGFQALNLVAQFRSSSILLVGFDMNPAEQLHWYGRNTWPQSSNPSRRDFDRWRSAIDQAAAPLTDRGHTVINASMNSTLNNYKKMKFNQAVECLLS